MKLIKRIYALFLRMAEDEVMMYSAQASFYIIISAIPFVMLLLSLIRFWIPLTAEDLIAAAQAVFPVGVWEYIADFVEELFQKPSISLVSVTAVTTIWTASRGFAAAERGIRRVYRVPKKGLLSSIGFSMLYTIALTAVLLITLIMLVFGKSIYLFLRDHYHLFAVIFQKTSWLRPMGYFVGACLLFALVYKAFAGWKTKYKTHIPGAVFATAGWMVFSHLYSIYIENFANYSYIYGSLTALVLMMLWLYSCMIILLLGAEVNMAVQTKQKGTKEQ